MITFRPRPRLQTRPADVPVADPKLLASSGKRVTTASVVVDRTEEVSE